MLFISLPPPYYNYSFTFLYFPLPIVLVQCWFCLQLSKEPYCRTVQALGCVLANSILFCGIYQKYHKRWWCKTWNTFVSVPFSIVYTSKRIRLCHCFFTYVLHSIMWTNGHMVKNIDTHSTKICQCMHTKKKIKMHADTLKLWKISFAHASVQSSLWDLNLVITYIHPDFSPDGERMGFKWGRENNNEQTERKEKRESWVERGRREEKKVRQKKGRKTKTRRGSKDGCIREGRKPRKKWRGMTSAQVFLCVCVCGLSPRHTKEIGR